MFLRNLTAGDTRVLTRECHFCPRRELLAVNLRSYRTSATSVALPAASDEMSEHGPESVAVSGTQVGLYHLSGGALPSTV